MQIETEPTFQFVSWVIQDYFDLPQENDFTESPEFLFQRDMYCIRLHRIESGDQALFQVMRRSMNFPHRKVSCKVGLSSIRSSGDEFYVYGAQSEENSRSRIEKNRDEYALRGSLTVVCCMWLSEDSTAGISTQREVDQGRFTRHNALILSRRSPAKMELTTEFPCTRVQLTVPDVSEVCSETGDSVTSPEFRFAGDSYCFRFEANGDVADTKIQLVRLTANFPENILYYRVGYGIMGSYRYSNDSIPLVGKVGFCASLSKLEEKRNKYFSDGNSKLFLFLHIGEESGPGGGTSDAVLKQKGMAGIHKLQCDLRQLSQEGTASDACLVVRGKEFKVHRAVLCARSPVFAAMFTHDMDEKESGRVVIDDLDAESFRDFLEYLYTGDLQDKLSDDNAFGLYTAAEKYDVPTLKTECVQYLRRNLSVNSFCDFVTLALRHSEGNMLRQAIRFLKDNFQLIIITAKWQQFNVDNAATANELFNKAFLNRKRRRSPS